MTSDQTLAVMLERFLKAGTIVCSVIIAAGVLLDIIEAVSIPVDLVTVGILGFIALPVIRLLIMLTNYLSAKDTPMTRVVMIVLALVLAGAVTGTFW